MYLYHFPVTPAGLALLSLTQDSAFLQATRYL